MEEREYSTITIKPSKDRPSQEIQVPFSEEEIGVIESLHKGMDALREEIGYIDSGAVRNFEQTLNFIGGLGLKNREKTLEELREAKQHLEKAIERAEEWGVYKSSISTFLKMREDFEKILPDEVEE